ncbi:MAG: aminotransferase class I/II-fold pyridoxal phosphate-dependent enzyme [Candidatus Thermoplasmatota archaeon]|nr:aminotransferase class I/II-fold pyridoxal phosphate-dependent enzyme [Candidatus Thermoplasmatota archaeon]
MNEIKLNMNEMPYSPPKEVIEAAQKGLSNLNRYANPKDLELLRELLANYSGVSKKNIILSAGSDILLREIIHVFSGGRKVIMVNPSFFPTVQCAKEFATKLIKIQLRPPEFNLDAGIIINEMNESSLVIIDNPNNPTGRILMDGEMAKAILENKNTLLVVDEAYYEFSGVTFADMVEEHPNLSVVRTLDKAFGLAGARVGYLIAGEDFLDAVSTFYAFLPQSSLYAAMETMRNPSYIKKNIKLTIKERERVSKELGKIGFQVCSSVTNFLLIKTNIPGVARELKDRGILVFDLSNRWLPGYIRVSIGTAKENNIFLSSIREILKACTEEG